MISGPVHFGKDSFEVEVFFVAELDEAAEAEAAKKEKCQELLHEKQRRHEAAVAEELAKKVKCQELEDAKQRVHEAACFRLAALQGHLRPQVVGSVAADFGGAGRLVACETAITAVTRLQALWRRWSVLNAMDHFRNVVEEPLMQKRRYLQAVVAAGSYRAVLPAVQGLFDSELLSLPPLKVKRSKGIEWQS